MKKKILAVLGITVLIFAFAACGGPEMKDSPYLGTWKAVTAEMGGMEFDMDEIIDTWKFKLLDSGKYDMTQADVQQSGDWSENENGFSLMEGENTYEFKVDGDEAVMEYEGMNITFERQKKSK